MTGRVYNVLFRCTGNSARSILAESILNKLGAGAIRAYSAGSFPKREVHSLALALLKQADLPTEGLRSKSWDKFAAPVAPPRCPSNRRWTRSAKPRMKHHEPL